MKQLSSTQIIVGPVRFSYLTVFHPRMNNLKEPPVSEYSAVLMIPKVGNEFLPKPNEELKGIADAIKAVLLAKFTTAPAKWVNPLKDGDVETNSQGEPRYPGYWFMNSTAKEAYPPKLVNKQLQDVTQGWNSGDWGLVKLNLFAFDQKVNKGVSCGLNAIQFLHKDESLGGGGANADGFDATAPTESESQEFDPFSED